jgi:hypothetical protein
MYSALLNVGPGLNVVLLRTNLLEDGRVVPKQVDLLETIWFSIFYLEYSEMASTVLAIDTSVLQLLGVRPCRAAATRIAHNHALVADTTPGTLNLMRLAYQMCAVLSRLL